MTEVAALRRCAGVTLIELTIVMVLVAILAAIALNFGNPIKAYVDTSRRAALADAADTALRRIGRDVHLALPNSVRVKVVDADHTLLEFALVRTGGRYRSEGTGGNVCGSLALDVLTFGASDTCFQSIGDVPKIEQILGTDYLVVYNLAPTTPLADVYSAATAGNEANKAKIDSAAIPLAGGLIKFDSNKFIYDSPGRRFFIVEGPVTYACDLTTGTLRRHWGYGFSATQPTSFPALTSAIMVSGVTACKFTYTDNVTSQGAGLVTMALTLRTQTSGTGTEDVFLYHAVHVNNVP